MFYVNVYDETLELKLVSKSRVDLFTDCFKSQFIFTDPDEITWTVWILTDELMFCEAKAKGHAVPNYYESTSISEMRKAYQEHLHTLPDPVPWGEMDNGFISDGDHGRWEDFEEMIGE